MIKILLRRVTRIDFWSLLEHFLEFQIGSFRTSEGDSAGDEPFSVYHFFLDEPFFPEVSLLRTQNRWDLKRALTEDIRHKSGVGWCLWYVLQLTIWSVNTFPEGRLGLRSQGSFPDCTWVENHLPWGPLSNMMAFMGKHLFFW